MFGVKRRGLTVHLRGAFVHARLVLVQPTEDGIGGGLSLLLGLLLPKPGEALSRQGVARALHGVGVHIAVGAHIRAGTLRHR